MGAIVPCYYRWLQYLNSCYLKVFFIYQLGGRNFAVSNGEPLKKIVRATTCYAVLIFFSPFGIRN